MVLSAQQFLSQCFIASSNRVIWDIWQNIWGQNKN
jgi:hypothetical protein